MILAALFDKGSFKILSHTIEVLFTGITGCMWLLGS